MMDDGKIYSLETVGKFKVQAAQSQGGSSDGEWAIALTLHTMEHGQVQIAIPVHHAAKLQLALSDMIDKVSDLLDRGAKQKLSRIYGRKGRRRTD